MDKEIEKGLEDDYTYHFFFNHGLFDVLKHYEDLIEETESFLKSKIDAMKGDTGEEITDERFGKEMQYQTIFPVILWKSLFLSSYFLLENSLDEICKNLRKSNSYELSLKDMSGNGISRSSLYLKKVCHITNSFQTQTWVEITDFNKIRNVLVHSDGVFPKSNADVINVCAKYGQIKLSEYDDNLIIEFDNEFCKYSLSQIENFITDIYKEMNGKRASH
ncbi:hypothetical protein HUK80_17395 [Flavobacterium sp. MAH-1]|uniref:RiboL-PSP-HEPN domain-containing protein n=1 Tax=Flavobacterium agri TaxID=2743471 RepID=A0A7Y8Y4Z1_9FLAO|nr:hypothetical protein [Flavobacterium agri]NUY82681.1 hypothetical protein [Flavobacterium agri]NYA72704.1 hypothetical protein [Flavobacterium agri]